MDDKCLLSVDVPVVREHQCKGLLHIHPIYPLSPEECYDPRADMRIHYDPCSARIKLERLSPYIKYKMQGLSDKAVFASLSECTQ